MYKKLFEDILKFLLVFFFFFSCCNPGKVNNTDKYNRIITLAPNLTEIIFALNNGKKIAAVTENTTFPLEAKKLPVIGGFWNPNLELILSQNPDLVVGTEIHSKILRNLNDRKIKTLSIKIDTINDVYSAIREIGTVLNDKKQAELLINKIRNDLNKIETESKKTKKIPALIIISHSSTGNIISASSGTFINEILKIAGGQNVIKTSVPLYPTITGEIIQKLNPSVIIEISVYPQKTADSEIINFWNQFSQIEAVKNQMIKIIKDDSFLIPGPRITRAAKLLFDNLNKEATVR